MGAAAAAVLIKERNIVDAFERAGATSAERARLPSDLVVHDGGVGWRRLTSRAVIRESPAGSGRFYVDLEVWQALRRTRRRRVVGLLLMVALLAALQLTVGLWSR